MAYGACHLLILAVNNVMRYYRARDQDVQVRRHASSFEWRSGQAVREH